MNGRIELQGASRRVYSFYWSDEEAAFRSIGVTYVIAVKDPAAWSVLAVGHASNLAKRC